jgi:hypothetical protein
MILPMEENQFAFREMRRGGTPDITIANRRGFFWWPLFVGTVLVVCIASHGYYLSIREVR